MDHRDPMYDLLGKVGEIASDIKHIMNVQAADREAVRDLDTRLRAVEAFRWKLIGIATTIPVVVTVLGWFVGEMK